MLFYGFVFSQQYIGRGRMENRKGNMLITYLDALTDKCLRLEAHGAGLFRAMLTIPSVIKPGHPFAATVSLLDWNAMPLISQGETVTLVCEAGHACEITFPKGCAAVARVRVLVAPSDAGFFRLEARIADQVYVSNPALVTDQARPLLLWGDPHIHTTVGDCHPERCRTRNLAYIASRHVYGLDFVAIADHVSWAPRGTAGKWYDNLAACELFDEPGVFSALYCYETSMKGGRGGDCNVYLKQPNRAYVDPWPEDLHIAGLCARIEGEFFVVPHHTTRAGKHGEIPREVYPGAALMPLVEIHSKWGTSEYRGNPTPLLEVHRGPSYVQDLLAQGYRFGFAGGTDSHTSLTFCRWLETEAHRAQPGLTAVLAPANTRNDVWRAMQARCCYAACGERIWLDVQCSGLQMGQSGPLPEDGRVTICATYAAESTISRVEIIRNNRVIYTVTPDDWNGQFSWTDTEAAHAAPVADVESGKQVVFYYVRVTAAADARAWSSPCWFERQTLT
jgi:hypothetical protein